jgi:4-hydroxy-tetrahydrodipicolinate synthase
MNKNDWKGVFPALTTKFTEADDLDFDAMARHLEFQLEAGVHGVILLGSLGENPALDMSEKVEMVRFFADQVGGRVPVVACVAESGTRRALSFVTQAEQAGADGFMVLPPMRYASDRTSPTALTCCPRILPSWRISSRFMPSRNHLRTPAGWRTSGA